MLRRASVAGTSQRVDRRRRVDRRHRVRRARHGQSSCSLDSPPRSDDAPSPGTRATTRRTLLVAPASSGSPRTSPQTPPTGARRSMVAPPVTQGISSASGSANGSRNPSAGSRRSLEDESFATSAKPATGPGSRSPPPSTTCYASPPSTPATPDSAADRRATTARSTESAPEVPQSHSRPVSPDPALPARSPSKPLFSTLLNAFAAWRAAPGASTGSEDRWTECPASRWSRGDSGQLVSHQTPAGIWGGRLHQQPSARRKPP